MTTPSQKLAAGFRRLMVGGTGPHQKRGVWLPSSKPWLLLRTLQVLLCHERVPMLQRGPRGSSLERVSERKWRTSPSEPLRGSLSVGFKEKLLRLHPESP
jgi:hypothetical protein